MNNKFFSFFQNNSGGGNYISKDSGIGKVVVIEAQNASEANCIAESIGLYFNGVDDGSDCPCCGDRWNSQDRGSRGDDYPTIFGINILTDGNEANYWLHPIAIHYKSGNVKWLKIKQ